MELTVPCGGTQSSKTHSLDSWNCEYRWTVELWVPCDGTVSSIDQALTCGFAVPSLYLY